MWRGTLGHAIRYRLLEVGTASQQLDTASRGFSYRSDGPLDMRMGQDEEASSGDTLTANVIVNRWTAEQVGGYQPLLPDASLKKPPR